ncbi:penicillin acylase family protein [Aureispira anguillae]|uniref:Penicillin acylase family protein n=1 Tax=Aureispira anguillae TaxID=2864201 RepID=A0A915YC22_9BACT|nr:penicillin acylase family protein [Aureispira anguillae]BDS10320.1 penicillin acylase family protein [Aureispira anguillae]
MNFFKLFLSFTITTLFIWVLGNPYQAGSPEQISTDENGEMITIASTEKFIPPIGKLLSPSHGFWQNAESATPSFETTIYNEQLSAPVVVKYDDRMVPHIFAENLEDATFAQGYVTASLRLWQMELQTHAAAGRLAEILGTTEKVRKILVEKDLETRRIGLPLGAKRSIELWSKDPEKFKALDAYSDGINAYINSLSYSDLPLFYKLQNYEPEMWSPIKTALLLKNMGRTLTEREHDFELTNVLKKIGLEQFNSLYAEYFEEQSPIILDSMSYLQPLVVDESKPINLYLGNTEWDSLAREYSPKGIGSNNWAVSGAKTASGKPILCNDPHLKLNLPSIWFEIQICTPEFNSYGASLPGAPGVISGFNENIAWGVTNVSHDVKDWYAVQWKDDSKTEYWFDSTYKKSSRIIEEIKVRGANSVFDTILMTHFGPVAHRSGAQDFVLRWTLHDASEEPLTFLKLIKGKNYDDYKDAIRHFACPAQNIVFAAKDGDIALWTQGKLPLRKEMQGRFVQQGTSSDELWSGFIPQKDIPHEYNPSKNFVASANQHSVNPSLYPYDYYGYFEEYRGRYLNRRLMEMENITVEDMMALQYDSYSLKAEDFMGLLKRHIQKGALRKDELEIWHLLKDWDYKYTQDQIEPTIFEMWFDTLEYLVYDELVDFNEKNVNKSADKELIRLPEEYNLLHLLKRDTTNAIIDVVETTEKREEVADVMTLAFQRICQHVPKDDNGQILTWKNQRGSIVQHLSTLPAFSVDDIPSDGHGSTLNALTKRPGPSWRMVVELGEEINAYGIYPGGQSENPGSYYYKNMLDKWAKGEHYKLLFMKDKDAASDRIVFTQDFN